jgi:hypothetical protein
MSVSDEAILNAAIKIGEKHGDLAMKYALQVRDMRRDMRVALALLKSGKTDRARSMLERALYENR